MFAPERVGPEFVNLYSLTSSPWLPSFPVSPNRRSFRIGSRSFHSAGVKQMYWWISIPSGYRRKELVKCNMRAPDLLRRANSRNHHVLPHAVQENGTTLIGVALENRHNVDKAFEFIEPKNASEVGVLCYFRGHLSAQLQRLCSSLFVFVVLPRNIPSTMISPALPGWEVRRKQIHALAALFAFE
jgi:hypothetical protein